MIGAKGDGPKGRQVNPTTTDSTLTDPQRIIADLRRTNAELQRRLDESTAQRKEALAQQIASAEVLAVINTSPGELAPVFDVMLEKAMRLCEAAFGTLFTRDGQVGQLVAQRNVPEAFAEYLCRHPVSLKTILGPNFRDGPVVQIADLAASAPYRDGVRLAKASVDLGGVRSVLVVPLVRSGLLLGIFAIYRREVRPFTDKQIALLEGFAGQAVLAMENARLIAETREALEQHTATVEVLSVINSSPGDLAPVFDAILEKAARLCRTAFGVFDAFDGKTFQTIALRGASPALAEFYREPRKPMPGSFTEQIVQGASIVSADDLAEEAIYRRGRGTRAAVDLGGARSFVGVALRKDERLLGVFWMYRQEVRPFSEREIALLQNFAAQAVIAMENARLITETREALERQTATTEVLQLINASAGHLTPVFDAMLEKALRLCDVAFGSLLRFDGSCFHRVATRNFPAVLADRNQPLTPYPGSALARLTQGEPFVHIADITADQVFRSGYQARRAMAEAGARTAIWVALRKDEALLGAVVAYRREVLPFADRQIAFLQNFAQQAVIAMENARLLDEIRQRQQELRVTFDNMADGVAMFDETLHLAAWNTHFQELLDLPDDFFAAPQTYGGFIRYLSERGEYGDLDPQTEIARLHREFGDHFRFERTRPDGTVLEVRRTPLPEGGFVLIYSDITERRRSEEQIRAARDTAEAAYRDLQAAQANLVQAQKMAALGQLTAGIAHEIKNPLNFVNNFAGLSVELLDELKNAAASGLATLDADTRAVVDETIEMLTANLGKIAEHGARADNIVKSMLEHSRTVGGERREIELNRLIDDALNLAYHGARAQDQSFSIALERDYAANLKPIELAPQEITRVFLNLFANGFYAANERARENAGASFRPVLAVTTREVGSGVEIRVRDNGTGIRPEIKDKLFQPFFTTKPTGEGTGLGLSISYDIIAQHGGTIAVESEPGSFTEFTVRLPRR
jgi:signal transduction histidine kinase